MHFPILGQEKGLRIISHALVILRLDYCNMVYMGFPLKPIQKNLLVQNAAVQAVMGMYVCPCNTSAAQAALLPVCFQMQFKVLVIIYKIVHGIRSGYLRNHLSPITSA